LVRIAGSSATTTTRFVEAFRQGLRELGWVEGQNIVVEYRYADGKFERLPDLAAELVQLKVEVIVATPTPAAVAAGKATTTVPIVMRGVGDPVGLGLVSTLARPGGNVTGLSYSVGTETFGKGLELLKETVPNVQRVAILSNPANPLHDLALSDLKDAARWLGVQLQLLEARGPEGFDGAFAALARESAEAHFVVADSMFFDHRTRLADLALKSRLPSMYGNREAVEAGGLMSYGPDFAYQFRQAAVYVDKILKGASDDHRRRVYSARFPRLVWPGCPGHVPPGRRLHRENPRRRETRRSAGRAAD
jgi:putative tryptophan/tyrosine transport system substrate-binding protein